MGSIWCHGTEGMVLDQLSTKGHVGGWAEVSHFVFSSVSAVRSCLPGLACDIEIYAYG